MGFSKPLNIIIALVIIGGIAGAAIYGGGLLYTTKISEIKANPSAFSGKEIYIKGTVTERISIWGFQGFTVDDGTGEIYVDWSGSLPAIGDKVIVKGFVKTFFGSAYIQATEVRNAWF